uniref:Variant surface glycoprotein 1125.1570 n=1 Tax=Trypanosoma brucei TaxID=5691 RepID=A0A1J0R7L3_9TRYP|nr:variant surface glycoprotein 1125.1570 [Trypanosoma brucei]
MAPKKTAALFLLMTAAVTKPTLAAIQTENAQDFSFPCGIANLEDVDPKKPSLAADFSSRSMELRQMNMTTADQEWQKQFDGDKKDVGWAAKQAAFASDAVRKNWAGQWDDWVDDNHRAYKEGEGKKWHQNNPTPADDWAKAAAHTAINATLSEVIEAVSGYTEAKTAATTTKPQEAKQAILEALYGPGATANTKIGAFTTPTGTTYGAKCAANGGTSLWNDMLCLCGRSDNSASDECGIAGVTINFGGDTATNIQALKAKCPSAKPETTTAATIRR